jgi:DNA-binding NarL/FixJ family response regulator
MKRPAGHTEDSMTLFIVDDHPAFRRAVRRTLTAGGFDVVGEAAGVQAARDALDGLDALKPRVVLLDVNLPDGDGFEIAEWLRGQENPPMVVMTSDGEAEDLEELALRSGALAFVEKARLTARTLSAALAG